MMRILALDMSTGNGSVALLDCDTPNSDAPNNDTVVYQTPINGGGRSAQMFAVTIDDALRRAAWEPRSIGLVALTQGPGSFTGLRTCVTIGKVFAYATGADLVAINTLDVIVEQLPYSVVSACAVMDAQRRQLFAAVYRRAPDGTWKTVAPCEIVDRETLTARLHPSTVLTGPALKRLPIRVCPDLRRASPDCWAPCAATVGRLAWKAYQAGTRNDIWKLQPQYYRPSYAEEGGG
ncbi:MAG: tRNA (adenosine(37)-N6)-threonylcarbamoyltransferase complex dimerization subunit type 1 TsaB [Planctomycetaceae bacterium]|nr:tRNA (adenosine(37)-N6)-threonylcarbamoyltransferase complex dimerization subunit type 1 TsaB [Planctomycetaceae bacterium]